jgi:hypothetical protein
MNALIEQWGARNVGFACMALAALCLLAAGMVAWEALSRGMGILELEQAQAAALADDRRAALAHAREAAGWMPREAAAGVLAVDLTDPKAGAELARLELRVPQPHRPLVAAIAALHQLHHGGTPGQSLGAGDQAVVAHLRKLASGPPPTALVLPESAPPQAPLLAYAAQARFRAAWASGDRDLIRATAGELRLLMPRHPDGRAVALVLAALSQAIPDTQVGALAGELPKGDKRDLVLLKLLTLAPARTAVLKPLLPALAGATP